jgi:hypothetical protein
MRKPCAYRVQQEVILFYQANYIEYIKETLAIE